MTELKNLLNNDLSIFDYKILNNADFDAFTELLEDYGYDTDEIQDLIYSKDGLLNKGGTTITVIVDRGARAILNIYARAY